MILAITYLSCSLSPPGSQTSLFGLFSIPVVYLPYALIGMDAAMGGPAAAAQGVSGAIVGHLWWWSVFDSRALADAAKAPGFVRALVSDGAAAPEPAPGATPAFGTGSGVEAIRPRARAGAGTGGGGGNTGGYQWGGSGHRLGTD
jgi:Derlin-2/3